MATTSSPQATTSESRVAGWLTHQEKRERYLRAMANSPLGQLRKHLLHGLRQAARVHFAAGADEVLSLHSKRTHLERSANGAIRGQQLRELDRQLERHGMGVNRLMLFTAHQMGTCRMGADPKTSVTNEHGEVHSVKGLFVCDGSLFPAASGVNPMLSIMGLAYKASQYIKSTV